MWRWIEKCPENQPPPATLAILATAGHGVSRDGCSRSQVHCGGIGGGRGGPGVVEEVAFGCFCLYYSSKSQVS